MNERNKKILNSIAVKEIRTKEEKKENWELRWEQKYSDLIEFRRANPKSWPQYNSQDLLEKALGIWCQDLRSRYKKNTLNFIWIQKLRAINFNLEGRTDIWQDRFKVLEQYINTNKTLPSTEHEIYSWMRLQYKKFDKLSAERQQLLVSLRFIEYCEESTWEERFRQVKDYMLFYKKAPTKHTDKTLYNWLSVQRLKYKEKRLAEDKQEQLKSIGVDLAFKEVFDKIWDEKFEALVSFREKNPDRWPSYWADGVEKKLYLWCQAQRQVKAGTSNNRKNLSQERIEKLNNIGFYWSLDEINEESWESYFELLRETLAINGPSYLIPTNVNGKANKLYTWITYQKNKMKANKLSNEKVKRLIDLGSKHFID